MNGLWIVASLLFGSLALAGSPYPNVGTNPTKPNPTATPVPSNPPRNCSAGLPIGQPPKRTENNLGNGVTEIIVESYTAFPDRIEHRIQTGRAAHTALVSTTRIVNEATVGRVYQVDCTRKQDIYATSKVRTMPLWNNCAWSNWSGRVDKDIKFEYRGMYEQDLVSRQQVQARGTASSTINPSASSPKGSKSYRNWLQSFNGAIIQAELDDTDQDGIQEKASVLRSGSTQDCN